MVKRWMLVALLAGCLLGANRAHGQSCPDDCIHMVPGPIQPNQAPPGPGGDLGLDPDTPNAWDPCSRCNRPDYCCNGMWFSGEYLLWVFRDPANPIPLVSAHPNPAVAPVIGTPGTTVLIRPNDLQDTRPHSGARINAGFWLDSDRTWSIEGSGFVLEKRGKGRQFRSTGDATGPSLGIPFFDADAGAEAVQVFADDTSAGLVSVLDGARLWGADGNVVCIGCCCGCEIAWLAGFRYFDLSEILEIQGAQFDLGTGTLLNAVVDRFRTHNQFYGAQTGIRIGGTIAGLFIAVEGKVAYGSNHQLITIEGFTPQAGGTTVLDGFFATTSNSGRFTRNQFAIVPQATLKVGVPLNRYMMVYAGYDYLYWHEVVRPGDQIDRNISANPPPPFLPFRQNFFWAQGINVGLEMRW